MKTFMMTITMLFAIISTVFTNLLGVVVFLSIFGATIYIIEAIEKHLTIKDNRVKIKMSL